MASLKNRTRAPGINISSDLEKLKAALFDKTYDFRDKTGEMFTNTLDNLKDHSSAAQEKTAEYVSEKPFKTIGIALTAGLIIGWLVNRK
jgi:ElaB/YqjD/DUF883 family membrane-anchored ribosome-binding protein